MTLHDWLAGLPHMWRRGHMPIWYDLGLDGRYCVNCSRGGRPAKRTVRPVFAPLSATLGMS